MAGTPLGDETKMAFVCAHVRRQTKTKSENVCLWEACVCVLWGETVNYLQSQTPDNATTVLRRASASGKQPSSLFCLLYLCLLSLFLYAVVPTPFSHSTVVESTTAGIMFSHEIFKLFKSESCTVLASWTSHIYSLMVNFLKQPGW